MKATRRSLLLGAAGLAFSAHGDGRVINIGEENPNVFSFSRFKFRGGRRAQDEWEVEPVGDENLLNHVREHTKIELTERGFWERVVEIDNSESMKTTPFLFMTGEVDFTFTPGEREVMAEFFRRGGFLLADDCVSNVTNQRYFYESLQREIPLILPGYAVKPLPREHEIYHCMYDIPNHAAWWPPDEAVCRRRFPDAGMEFEGRLAVFLTAADIHCSWARRHPQGRAVFDQTVQMGTNVIVYALTH